MAALTVGGGLEAAAGGRAADLVVMATRADAGGEPMTLACELDFAAVPSNRFTGACQISVGPDHVLLGGMDVDGVPILTVVLNGVVPSTGWPGGLRPLPPARERRERRFSDADRDRSAVARLGDPWRHPGGPRQTISRGRLSEGAIDLAMPTSSAPADPEAGISEESVPRGPTPP